MGENYDKWIGIETIHLLAGTALRASQAVMDVYEDAEAWDLMQKDDDTPVTRADLISNQVIVSALKSMTPHIPILSEESPWAAQGAQSYWAVDPLDGTKEFIKRNGEFTVNIALVVNGITRIGVISAPALKTIWAGVRGAMTRDEVSTIKIRDLTVDSMPWAARVMFDSFNSESFADSKWSAISVAKKSGDAKGRLRLLGSRSHGGDELPHWLVQPLSGATVIEKGSSLKFCLIAQGDADVYVRMGPTSIWDTAAGHAILAAAGGAVMNAHTRDELAYPDPRVVLNPSFVAYAANFR